VILDANGRPYVTAGSRIVRRSSADTFSTHPGVGMTPDAYAGYLRLAERGDPVRQFDTWEDLIETDGHGRGLMNTRIEFTSGCDWTLTPGRADKPSELAAAALDERIRSRGTFREFLEHHLTAPFFGIAVSNLVWDFLDGMLAPEFINVAHRRFRAPSQERADEIMLVNPDENGRLSLQDLERGLWAISRYRHRNPWAAGLFRTLGWWIMFKRLRIRDWSVFAEMFGLPLTIGFYEEGASAVSRAALEDAVRSIGTDGYAVLSNLCDIVLKECARSGDSSTVYPKIADRCDAEMSKLIAGGTANTDIGNKGSYAAGSIHADRAYALGRADATRLNEMFTRDIGEPFVRFNGFDRAAPPQLTIYTRRDGYEFAQTLQIIGQVIDIDQGQLYQFFGLRKPADGKGVKFPTKDAVGNAKPTEGGSDGN
jgi:phage gp29-like protein